LAYEERTVQKREVREFERKRIGLTVVPD